jgi:hypothetical protein
VVLGRRKDREAPGPFGQTHAVRVRFVGAHHVPVLCYIRGGGNM